MLENRATLNQLRFYLLAELRKRYSENESASVTSLILEHAGFPLSLCLREPDKITPSQVITQINHIIEEIHVGRPIQHILGNARFCELTIAVNGDVLIPRPETEALVYTILSSNDQLYSQIIDLGTGSGCIALALKKQFPEALVLGLDLSRKALSVAEQNAKLNQLDVVWMQGDLLDIPAINEQLGYKTGFDLVVSNPPYVRQSEKRLMEDQVLNYEPSQALFVDDQDPLLFYRAILAFCKTHLLEGGHLWVEINESFGKETAYLFREAGLRQVEIKKDIHEKERFIHARK
jgi:release factor glutamine methyltransferase